MLPVSLSISPKFKTNSDMFFSKKGYHVSLICLEELSNTDQNKVLNLAQKYPVRLQAITNTFRLVTQKDQRSIIVRVRLTGLKWLLSAVNTQFGYKFNYPPTHITLFVLKGQHGIAVDSTDAYHRLTHQISQKYSRLLTKSFRLI
jgi:hypothetical protein